MDNWGAGMGWGMKECQDPLPVLFFLPVSAPPRPCPWLLLPLVLVVMLYLRFQCIYTPAVVLVSEVFYPSLVPGFIGIMTMAFGRLSKLYLQHIHTVQNLLKKTISKE